MSEVALLAVAAAFVLVTAVAATALLRPDSRLDAAVTVGILATASVAATMLVAGLAGALRPGVVVALHGGLAAAAIVVLRWKRPEVALRWKRPEVAQRRKRPRTAPTPVAGGAVRRHPWTVALVLLAAAALAWQVVVALVLPPFAYDALTYHLTTVATWVQRGNLAPTPLSLCCAYYPAGPELLMAWPALLLGGDRLVDTVQIPFAVLGAVATAGIARTAGSSRGGAAAAGALFAVTPALLTQVPTDYADVILAAVVLAALHALARFAVTGAPQRLVVAGLGAGFALGTKGTGIIWAAVVLVTAAAIAAALLRRGRMTRRAVGTAAGTALGTCLVLGGWWYLRNLVETGNPLHPFAVRAAGVVLFDGPIGVDEVLTVPSAGAGAPWPVAVALSWASDLDFWNQGSYDYQQRLGGLGPLWPWLGLPLLVPLTVVLIRRRSPALVVVAAVAVTFAVQPYQWWARFTLPLAALGAVAIVAAAEAAPRLWLRRAVRVGALALAAAGVVLSSFAVDPAATAKPLPSTRVLALAGAPAAERTLGRLFHAEYAFLEQVPPDATVVVDLAAEPVRFVSPLFGTAFSRTVLPADGSPPPAGAWVVTSRDRPVDRELAADPDRALVSDVRDVRVWQPAFRPLG